MSPDPTPSGRRSSLHVRSLPSPAIPGYHVLERLGAGRNGTVYRAIQLSMQREVALRVLDVRLNKIAGFSERFMQEVRSAGGIHHPNVVSCYDVGQADGVLFQAMELVAGRTLAQVQSVHPQGIAVAQALTLVVEMTRGLEGIHRGGLMHGDLRLGNVFVNDDDAVKLADFGMLRSLEVLRGGNDLVAGLATLAPEQLQVGGQCDIRSDLYGIGAVLYVLLTGRQPFSGRSRRELEQAIQRAPRPDPQRLVADLGDDLAAVLAKSMARDPAQRYVTPGQLREDLERVQYDFVPIHAMPLTAGPVAVSVVKEAVPGEVQPRVEPASSGPTRTLAKDAGFMLVPKAEERTSNRPWGIIGTVGGAAVVLGLFTWWRFVPASAVAPASAATPATSTTPSPVTPAGGPSWATAAGTDVHGRWADLAVRGVTLRLRWIPGGRFVMGTLQTDPNHRPDEQAVEVTLTRGWWMGDSEVTQAQYRAVTGTQPSSFHGDDLPVENITWHDAIAFTQRLDTLVSGTHARLPTEAEWEYACRAGADRVSNTSEVGWFSAPEITATKAVRQLPASPWGLYDMLGNVAEWCQDHYGPYPTQPATDPLRLDGVSRVVRGGSWAMDAEEGRPTRRGKYLPMAHLAHVGLRLVIDE